MRDTFWIGVYPGMTDGMVDRRVEVVRGGVKCTNPL
jgi:CDP-6-deoxy-D-xylo-4-hexulose-3-dehydrase